MSRKTLTSERSRSPPRRAPVPRPRLRVWPLFFASKVVGRAPPLVRTVCARIGRLDADQIRHRCRVGRRGDEPAATAATHLTTLPASGSRLVGGPLVSCPLLVCG